MAEITASEEVVFSTLLSASASPGQQIKDALRKLLVRYQLGDDLIALGIRPNFGNFPLDSTSAISSSRVTEILDIFNNQNIAIDTLQLNTLAFCNYLAAKFRSPSSNGTITAVDIGSTHSTIVIYDGIEFWTRQIQIGGNNFTSELMKLLPESQSPFLEAEKMKRSAMQADNPAAVFHCMKPAYDALVEELKALFALPEAKKATSYRKIFLYGAAKLPGTQHYLNKNFGSVSDLFEQLETFSDRPVTLFDNDASYAVAIGLALQQFGGANYNCNLIDKKRRRKKKISPQTSVWGFEIADSALRAVRLNQKNLSA